MSVARMPTASDVRAPQTMRAQMSQPWKVNPSGWPSAGPALLLARKHSSFGGVCVNSVGQTAIRMTTNMISSASQNVGRFRRSCHASDQRLRGLAVDTLTASTATTASLMGATKWPAARG